MPQLERMAVDLSVILPSYRAADVAKESAARLASCFLAWGLEGEVIVVDDGGGDFESPLPATEPFTLIILPRNYGKGAAIRTGINASRGNVIAYTDVDLPYGCDPIIKGYDQITERGFHLVIGDRWLPDSSFTQPRTRMRRLLSQLSATAIGTYLTGGFGDTQCGFKALQGNLGRSLFAKFVIDGFAFEVELIHTALSLGLDIKRLAVNQRADGPSSVRPIRHGLQSLRDLVRLRLSRRDIRHVHAEILALLRTA